jgi:hypothetical protein
MKILLDTCVWGGAVATSAVTAGLDHDSGRDPDQFRNFLTRLTRFTRLKINKIL